MKICSIHPELLASIPFLNAGRGPGNFYRDQLPVHLGFVDSLPDEVAAIIFTADLQGRETFESAQGQPLRLLGEILPSILRSQILPNLKHLSQGRIGVVLAGDFYTVPMLDKRGGSGDVTEVWNAFSDDFDWVVGVAGNHDTFGRKGTDIFKPSLRSNAKFLDGNSKTIDGIQFGGVSGIIGDPRRPWRKTRDDFVDAVLNVSASNPEITIMHDGPDCPSLSYRGSPAIREALELCPPSLVVRGHAHWPEPFVELSNDHQVLNVDCRVVIVVREDAQ